VPEDDQPAPEPGRSAEENQRDGPQRTDRRLRWRETDGVVVRRLAAVGRGSQLVRGERGKTERGGGEEQPSPRLLQGDADVLAHSAERAAMVGPGLDDEQQSGQQEHHAAGDRSDLAQPMHGRPEPGRRGQQVPATREADAAPGEDRADPGEHQSDDKQELPNPRHGGEWVGIGPGNRGRGSDRPL
jgi:hypothetical protein